MKKTIGGNRLGAGKKMTVEMKSYERSTHDLGYIWRSSMSAGTLVPFMSEVGLPGDTFDIDLDCDIKTHPTVGPLFGSYKIQLDVFQAPIRLYQGQLHNNALGIGMKMNTVKLPQLTMLVPKLLTGKTEISNSQINPSSLPHYLGIKGIGAADEDTVRFFNAVPTLAYWEIYKNYYANKQEEIGCVIHTNPVTLTKTVNTITTGGTVIEEEPALSDIDIKEGDVIIVNYTGDRPNEQTIMVSGITIPDGEPIEVPLSELLEDINENPTWYEGNYNGSQGLLQIQQWRYATPNELLNGIPKLTTFDLENIDRTREEILAQPISAPYVLNGGTRAPYGLLLQNLNQYNSTQFGQEGLAIKTYQSDLFNNWMNTEWIDGENGVSAVTAIDTSTGSFTLDTLNLSKKVYDMLNRIAISGGTYDDWLDTVYTHDRYTRCESPMYCGGLSKELVFQEVVSNSETEKQPLGSLAGRGVMAKKHKGGKITVKVDEPSYIIGIISLTPRVDYSQGNKWSVNLATMDDFHKPALDEIGFQELITEQLAWWDTQYENNQWVQKSAGKQPAWLNYMTNVNETHGNFAIETEEMFMTLNRRYEKDEITGGIKDLTTYIDPTKFNFIFAQTNLDSQNFWAQIAIDISARRKMSAKLMPNL